MGIFNKKSVKNEQTQVPESNIPLANGETNAEKLKPADKAFSHKRNIRVFISSTFRDMMEERDALMTHCWPELRRFCRELQVELVEVDLRWGIAEEQSTRKETLKLCLDEIRACRPFFIGLLGERYGWIPGDDAFTPDLKEEQPWLKGIHNKSVTELEILHGVLNNPEMAGRAFFYFRDPQYIETVPKEKKADFLSESPADAKKQNQLKDVIRATCTEKNIQLLENYIDPQALAPIILEQLKAAIASQFPKEDIPDELTREAREHEAFAEVRRRTYIGRPEYYNQLDKHAGDTGKPLLLLGDSGSGKSALVANWVEHWQQLQPNDYIFQHYIGGTNDSSDHWKLIKRLISDIKRWTDDIEELPKSNEDMLRDFPMWLSKARIKANRDGVKFIVIMDALNQLDDTEHAHVLGWLPFDAFKENLRLILSTLPGEILEVLEKKELTTLLVKPLTPKERGEMITEYLLRFGKALDKPRIERLSTNKATENPLYLKIVLDELRVTGTHDQLDQRLDDYLSATDIHTLLQKVLARYQRDYEHDRKGLVSDALSMIWAARRGLSESELLRLLKPEYLEQLPLAFWAPLRAALEDSLIERNGILNFAHDFLRKAVESAFLKDQDEINDVRIQLANFFDKKIWLDHGTYDLNSFVPMLEKREKIDETDELGRSCDKLFQYWYKVDNTIISISITLEDRNCDELPWLLMKTESIQRLRKCLLNIDIFLKIYSRDRDELRKYWVDMGEETSIGKDYLVSFETWKKINNEKWIADGAEHIGYFLTDLGLIADAEPFIKQFYLYNKEHSKVDPLEYADALDTRGNHLKKLKQTDEAEALYRESIKIYENHNNDSEISRPLNNLGELLSENNRLEEAELLIRKALKINEDNLGPNHPKVAINLTGLAAILYKDNRLKEAETSIRRAIKIKEDIYGVDNEDTSSLEVLSGILLKNENYDEAETIIRRMIKIKEDNYGKDNKYLASKLSNLAFLLYKTNRSIEAEPLICRAIHIEYNYIVSTGIWEADLETYASNYKAILESLGKNDEQIGKAILRVAPNYMKLNPNFNNDEEIPYNQNIDNKFFESFLNSDEKDEEKLRRNLIEKENKYGKDNPLITNDIYKLAAFLAFKNQNKEAELLMKRAIKIDEDNTDKDFNTIVKGLNMFALFLKSRSRFGEAEPLMRKAIQLLENNGLYSNQGMASLLNNLAQLLRATKQYNEAELLSRRAILTLVDLEKKTNQSLPELELYKNVYYWLLDEMDWTENQIEEQIDKIAPIQKKDFNNKEKEELLIQALEINEESFGKKHRIIVDILFEIVKFYVESNRLNNVESYLKRAVLILNENYIEDPFVKPLLNFYTLFLKELDWSESKISDYLHNIVPNLLPVEIKFSLQETIDQVNNLTKRAETEFELKHFDEAILLYQQQIQHAETILKSYAIHEENKKPLSISYNRLGEIYETAGLINEALNNFEKSLLIQKDLYESNPQNESLKNDLAIYYEKVGSIQQSLGLKDKALNSYIDYQKLSFELYEANPENTDYLELLCISFYRFAILNKELGNTESGRKNFDQWKEILNQLIEIFPEEPKYKEWESIQYDSDISDSNYSEDDEFQNIDPFSVSINEYIQTGEFEKALDLLQNQEEKFRKRNKGSDELISNIGEQAYVFTKMEKYKEAQQKYVQQAELCARAEMSNEYADSLLSQAELLIEYLDNPKQAKIILEEAIAVAKENNNIQLIHEAENMLKEIL